MATKALRGEKTATPGEEREPEIASRLVSSILAGDAEAEEELVARYSDGVLFFLRRRAGGRSDVAEDLHQETFRVVLERLRGRGLDDPSRLAGFIRRTAENLFLGHWRRAARDRPASEEAVAALEDRAPGPLDRTLLDEKAELVRRVLADLDPPRDRQLLYRYYLAEEPKESLCRELGLSSLHFNRVLYRAKKRLRDLLERAAKRRRVATWRAAGEAKETGR